MANDDGIRRLEDGRISVELSLDDDGFIGRACPTCKEYFKATPDSDVASLPQKANSFCPYCGHQGHPRDFTTEDQMRNARSRLEESTLAPLYTALEALRAASSKHDSIISVETQFTPHEIYTYKERRGLYIRKRIGEIKFPSPVRSASHRVLEYP